VRGSIFSGSLDGSILVVHNWTPVGFQGLDRFWVYGFQTGFLRIRILVFYAQEKNQKLTDIGFLVMAFYGLWIRFWFSGHWID